MHKKQTKFTNKQIEYNNTHDEHERDVDGVVGNEIQTTIVGGLDAHATRVQLADHHGDRLDHLIHRAVEIAHAVVLAYLERAQEAEIDHEKERHEFERVLDGLAQSDRVRAELEDGDALEKERKRDPPKEDGKRAECRGGMTKRQRGENVAEETRDLEPVFDGAEHFRAVVVDLKDFLEQVDQEQEEEVALVEPEETRARLVEHGERVGKRPQVEGLLTTRC